MKKIYRRIALLLCISMIAGIVGRSELKAASSLNVRLIIVDKFVTKKEYNLKLGKKRQLNVRVNNAFGKTKVTYSSADKTIAKVTKKGFIRAMALGSVKIRVKVKCTSGSKKKVKKTWVRINVIGNDDVYPTSDPVPEYTPSYTDMATPTTAPATGVMSAMLLVNGTTSKQFPMIILDNESGRMLYNSLPKVIYFTDQNQNTKTATETELIYAMDEFKPTNLAAGDLMLYGNSRYELTYEDHTSGYAYTRLARVTNVTGLKDALGTGPVSVTIIKSTLPTNGPSGTVAPTYAPGTSVRPTVTMPPILPVSPTPTPSLPPGVSAVPAATVTPGTTPRPSASATAAPSGSPARTAAPTPNQGDKINVTVNGFVLPFVLETSSSAANDLRNTLGSGTQSYEMVYQGSEDRYYAYLNKEYSERSASTPAQWPAGSLVLLGTNEITVVIRTISNEAARQSVIIGRLDPASIPDGSTASSFLRNYFSTTTVSADFSKG